MTKSFADAVDANMLMSPRTCQTKPAMDAGSIARDLLDFHVAFSSYSAFLQMSCNRCLAILPCSGGVAQFWGKLWLGKTPKLQSTLFLKVA